MQETSLTPGPFDTFSKQPLAQSLLGIGSTPQGPFTGVEKTSAKNAVSGAIRSAATATGADFDYLYKVAARESSLDPAAKASTSSATGLFQFIEQTWLGAVKNYGEQHGLGEAAKAIKAKPGGGFSVVPASARQAILDMRLDPQKSAALAGELAQENKRYLENRLGRTVKGSELYAAHFLGASGAAKLLSSRPEETAASVVPAAAKANRSVFYDGARGRSVSDVLASFEKTIGDTANVLNTATLENRTQIPITTFTSIDLGTDSSAPNSFTSRYNMTTIPGSEKKNDFSSVSVAHVARTTRSEPAPPSSDSQNLKELDSVLRKYAGVAGFSPVAAMVLQWFDPSTMRGNR
ncbi:MAG: transglycosylase SLT domain-containing protein [Pseudomonadota bacterium]